MPFKRALTIKEILMQPVPEVQWEVEGFITQGDRALLFGETGAGKSWLAHDMALSLAHGIPWLNKFPCTKRRVLFIDEEMSEQETRRRLRRVAWGRGITVEAAGDLLIASHSLGIFDVANLMTLRSTFREFNPEVIFIDSLRRVMPGDENKAQDVSAFWRSMETTWNAGMRTLVVLHHMNKPPAQGVREARYRASGSTDLIAGADSALAIGLIEPGAEGSPVRFATVEGVKARSTKEQDLFTVRWNVEMGDGPVKFVVLEKRAPGGPDPRMFGPPTQVCA